MSAEKEHKTPRIAIVIVNYQTGDLILEHLQKADVQAAAYPGSYIVIVDNASPNDDGEMLMREIETRSWKTSISVIASEKNGGFAAGNNVALRNILGENNPVDYVFLQNPDAYPHEGGFKRLVEFMEKTPKAGIAGARLEGLDKIPEVSAFRFFSIASDLISAARTGIITKIFSDALVTPPQQEGVFEVDWLCGAAVLIRREVFADVGLLDEAYFLYYEETDFMLQAKRQGWQRWYVSDAHYTHMIGQSSGVKHGKSKEKRIPDYWFDSRYHYFRKNHGALYTFAANLAWSFGSIFYIARSFIERRPTQMLRENLGRFVKHAFGQRAVRRNVHE